MPRGFNDYDTARLQGRLWTPAVLRPAAWFDAADQSTITISTGVSEWRDKSGNGNNLAQATSGTQPSFSQNSWNGLSTIGLSGSQAMRNTTLAFGTKYSIVCAFNRTGGSSYQRFVESNAGIPGSGIFFFGSLNGNFATFFGTELGWNDITENTPSISVSSPSVGSVVNNGDVINSAFPYVNGNEQNAKNGSTLDVTGFAFGAFWSGSSFSQWWQGNAAEILIIKKVLDIPELKAVEGYLSHKWAIRLAASHPFANRPPLIGD